MPRDPDSHVMEKAYARWAPVYDAFCGPIFVNGRRAAAKAARLVGDQILEIGVGTGLSFDDRRRLRFQKPAAGRAAAGSSDEHPERA